MIPAAVLSVSASGDADLSAAPRLMAGVTSPFGFGASTREAVSATPAISSRNFILGVNTEGLNPPA